MTPTTLPVLHVPDEPTVLADAWLSAVLDGRGLAEVIGAGENGVTAWFWSRWRTLASAGLGENDLGLIVLGYRREIWLWLAGERTWAQCCSGLIGRISRRLAGGGDGTQE
ncbi:MAG: hypothetical protein WAL61_05665 [Acidimicrobiales bacterium]